MAGGSDTISVNKTDFKVGDTITITFSFYNGSTNVGRLYIGNTIYDYSNAISKTGGVQDENPFEFTLTESGTYDVYYENNLYGKTSNVITISVTKVKLKVDFNNIINSHIAYGQVDNTSTSTVFTATVPNVNQLTDGTTVMLKNGIVTSAEGFTLNVNNLGAKPVYSNLANATRDTTIFNINYTMLFVYDSSRVTDGCWICYRGYDANTNTIGYQLRTNNTKYIITDKCYRYRILLQTSEDGKFMPVNTSTSTSATTSKNGYMNSREFIIGGDIRYYGTTSSVSANATISEINMWQQYILVLGYSFNNTNSALTLTVGKPVYMVAKPTSNGKARLNTPYYTQDLPSNNDGLIYILLGYSYDATHIEMTLSHPIFEYRDGSVGLYNPSYTISDVDDLLDSKSDINHTHTVSNITDFPTVPTKTSDLINDTNFISTSNTNGLIKNDGTIDTTTYSTFTGDYNDLTNKPTIPTVPTNISSFNNDSGYLTSHQDITGKEDKSNKVTSLSSSSTDTEYPSAKLVYDSLQEISEGITFEATFKERTTEQVFMNAYATKLVFTCNDLTDNDLNKDFNVKLNLNYSSSIQNTSNEVIIVLESTNLSNDFEAKSLNNYERDFLNYAWVIAEKTDGNYNVYNYQLSYGLSLLSSNILTIIDNLTTNDATKVLSAKQGKVLNDSISGKADSTHNHSISDVTNLQSSLNGKASNTHNHNITDLNNVSIVSVVVTYTDETTETIQLLKYTGS